MAMSNKAMECTHSDMPDSLNVRAYTHYGNKMIENCIKGVVWCSLKELNPEMKNKPKMFRSCRFVNESKTHLFRVIVM